MYGGEDSLMELLWPKVCLTMTIVCERGGSRLHTTGESLEEAGNEEGGARRNAELTALDQVGFFYSHNTLDHVVSPYLFSGPESARDPHSEVVQVLALCL